MRNAEDAFYGAATLVKAWVEVVPGRGLVLWLDMESEQFPEYVLRSPSAPLDDEGWTYDLTMVPDLNAMYTVPVDSSLSREEVLALVALSTRAAGILCIRETRESSGVPVVTEQEGREP